MIIRFFAYIFFLVFTLSFSSSPIVYCLIIVISCLIFVVLSIYNYFMRSILGVIVILVYLGAIIILIGYVCAVTPNFIARLNFKAHVYLPIIFSFFPLIYLFTSLFFPQNSFYLSFPTIKISIFLFNSFSGLILLCLFIILLLLTLIMSTYLGVKSSMTGPFRS